MKISESQCGFSVLDATVLLLIKLNPKRPIKVISNNNNHNVNGNTIDTIRYLLHTVGLH